LFFSAVLEPPSGLNPIASLEELKGPLAASATPVRSRRGRKSMSLEERREVSARMKVLGWSFSLTRAKASDPEENQFW
jgi:hypothetical protein